MNRFIKTSVLFIILSLFSYNQAQAGFFDWLKSGEKDPNDLLTKIISKNQIPFEAIYGWNEPQTDEQEPKEELKKEFRVIKTYAVRVTGYSSTPDQTDDTPFITASGTYVREGIVATNFLPFGTRVRIPKIYGEKVFVVEDRMNKRYWHNVDIWFPERNLAKVFGSKRVTIEIVEES